MKPTALTFEQLAAAMALSGSLAFTGDPEQAVEDALEAMYMLRAALQRIDGGGQRRERARKRAKAKDERSEE